jgi:hypothetical protein
MKAYGRVDVYIHIFLTSALVGGEWSASGPGSFISGTHWIGGWVDRRAGVDDMEKCKFLTLPGLELRPLSRQARSQSLYRLRYRVHILYINGSKDINLHHLRRHEYGVTCSGKVFINIVFKVGHS